MKRRYHPDSPARRLSALAGRSAPVDDDAVRVPSGVRRALSMPKDDPQHGFFEHEDEEDESGPVSKDQAVDKRAQDIRTELHQIARDLSSVARRLADFAAELGTMRAADEPAQPTPRPIIPSERSTVTVDEAAHMLGLSRNTTYKMVQRGEIKARRFGKRWVVPVDSLREILGG